MAPADQLPEDRLWIPDNADGSGWAEVDWTSVIRGSRYHYRHAEAPGEAAELRPAYYRVVTRLESARLSPHENSYFVKSDQLADFLAEVAFSPGAEVLWHVEPCLNPPAESQPISRSETSAEE
ncbi:MAG: hypothetical protein M3354_03365 [Chloroflexota bacterium]|nr:hypothetical protein [Chloroflexota bacterium]